MNLMKRKEEIEARLAEIRTSSTDEKDVDKLAAFEKECDSLQEERTMIEKKMNIASKSEVKPLQIIETKGMTTEELEKRGKDIKEGRTITVASDEILLPEHTANEISPVPFSEVSTLVDKVNVVNLNGGETYKKSFVKSSGDAGLTLEGAAYTETEPKFGYLTITKVKITAYTEITEELEKLPALPYQAEVLKNINTSLRKKISQQILKGAGTSNTFTGIFSDEAVALADSTPLQISEITDTTLDDIVFAYGGDEEVEGGACLILNKNDLRAFAKLRTAEGRKVHTIDYVAQTIDGIPYVINSNCKALSDSATVAGEYCIAYGSLKNYEVPVFSPVEIGKSTDYKFKDGIICYKASVFTGGNVVGYNGFLRVKKAAAAAKESSTN
ncbi:MAG: phage major capsid protein [Candidatus Cloacimonetes bacterium]|jgi:HK97 family phage major capsid protein|nr:phage major capsid protein [Candidatus Cloacimonadota bacterium]